jgi:hypothetical protein
MLRPAPWYLGRASRERVRPARPIARDRGGEGVRLLDGPDKGAGQIMAFLPRKDAPGIHLNPRRLREGHTL